MQTEVPGFFIHSNKLIIPKSHLIDKCRIILRSCMEQNYNSVFLS